MEEGIENSVNMLKRTLPYFTSDCNCPLPQERDYFNQYFRHFTLFRKKQYEKNLF